MSVVSNGQILRALLAMLALATIAAASTLSALGDDASPAWGLAAGIVGLIAGQHLPDPEGRR